MPEPLHPTATPPIAPHVARLLVAHHARFLAFVERRVASPAIAEEILQEAFVRSIDRGGALREGESAIAWFYRLLRNAIVDHHRRRAAERRAVDAASVEPEPVMKGADEEMMGTVCACVGPLVDALPEGYADAVKRVDLEGLAVRAYATQVGITANHAGVRLHRAREALRRRLVERCGACAAQGCLQCTCAQTGASRLR